jgi:hypothetical protein
MDYVENGNTFVLRWSSRRLEEIINMTLHDQLYVVSLLKEDDMTDFSSNPIRGMIVNSVINKQRHYEIWKVTSTMSEEDIVSAFYLEPEEIKNEIRSVGELIYTTIGT